MLNFKRNQVIITALVAMIGVAGYLNWRDGQQPPFAQAISLDDHGQIVGFTPGEIDEDYIVYGDDFYSIFDAPWIASEFDWDLSYDYGSPAPEPWFDAHVQTQAPLEPGEAVFVSTQDSPPYFVQARLEREQSRARQTDILMNMISDMYSDAAQVSIIADAMLEIQRRIERETAAEAMIESKGFREVYVRIGDEYVDVVVNRETLSDSEVAQIEDIVRRKTGMAITQIRISPMRR